MKLHQVSSKRSLFDSLKKLSALNKLILEVYMPNTFKLSFCSTCMNRKESLKKTLPVNLEIISKYAGLVELNLVNFIRDDEGDEIHDWILSLGEMQNFNYHVCTEMDFWHASIAKNTSHLCASGFFLVNLDCDNFISEKWINDLCALSSYELDNSIYLGYTGQIKKVYQPWRSNNFKIKYKFIADPNKDKHDGSAGLIGCSSRLFIELGGYDEGLPAMGGQDKNFLRRMLAFKPKINIIHIPPLKKPLKNSKSDGLINSRTPDADWKQYERLAYKKTKNALRKNQLQANIGESIGLETKNGYGYIFHSSRSGM